MKSDKGIKEMQKNWREKIKKRTKKERDVK